MIAGLLEARGLPVKRARVRVSEEQLKQAERRVGAEVLARVVAWVRSTGFSHLVVVRDHFPELARDLAQALPELVIVTVRDDSFPSADELASWVEGRGKWRPVARDHLTTYPDDLVALVRHGTARFVVTCEDLTPEVTSLGFDGDLFLDHLCYYRAPYAGEAHAALKGTSSCSFCDIAQPEHRSVKPDPARLAEQIAGFARDRPTARCFHLIDANALSHLEEIAEATISAAHAPLELCLDLRVPDVLRHRERLERALARLAPHGHVLNFYCTGFESFSPREWSRLNKGYPVVDNVAGLLLFRDLSTRYPGTFEYQRLAAHGFINLTPWTTPEDLLINAWFARALGFERTCRAWYLRKLRIYDSLPIARLAEADGVFIGAYDDWRHDNAHWKGYRPERPWRFLDARTAVAAGWILRTFLPESPLDTRRLERLRQLTTTRVSDDWEALVVAAIAQACEQARDGESEAAVFERIEAWASLPELELLPARRVLAALRDLAPAPAGLDPTREEQPLELGLLRAGIKPAMKLEFDARSLRGSLEQAGYLTVELTTDRVPNALRREGVREGHFPIFLASRERAPLEVLERIIRRGGHGTDPAETREVGAALGYPPCCVEAFLDRARFASDDLRMLACAAAATRGPARPELDPTAPWALIEYVPCRLDCEASTSRAERARGAGLVGAVEPAHFAPQLVLSTRARVSLLGASPTHDGWAYREARGFGADERLGAVLAALAEGDRLSVAASLLLVWRGDRLIHALPEDELVPWAPGEPARFPWLRAIADGSRPTIEPPKVPLMRLVVPESPSALTQRRFERMYESAADRIGTLVDDDGWGYALLFEDGEYAFFRGRIEELRGATRVRIDALLHHQLPSSSPRTSLYRTLRPGAVWLFDAAGNGTGAIAGLRLEHECDVVAVEASQVSSGAENRSSH